MRRAIALAALATLCRCTCAPPAPATPCQRDKDCPPGYLCDTARAFCFLEYETLDGGAGDRGRRDASDEGAAGDTAGFDQAPLRLNGPPAALRDDVALLGVSPDGAHALYQGDGDRLYSTQVDGTTACSTALAENESVQVLGFSQDARLAVLGASRWDVGSWWQRFFRLDLASCDFAVLYQGLAGSSTCPVLFSPQAGKLVHGCSTTVDHVEIVDVDSLAVSVLPAHPGFSVSQLQLGADGAIAIFTLRAPGPPESWRIHTVDLVAAEEWTVVPETQAALLYPTLSPDSSRLAYVEQTVNGQTVEYALRVVDLDGTRDREVETGARNINQVFWPDARTLAYLLILPLSQHALHLAYLLDSGVELETPLGARSVRQIHSVSGSPRLVALENASGQTRIHVVDAGARPASTVQLSRNGEYTLQVFPALALGLIGYTYRTGADQPINSRVCDLEGTQVRALCGSTTDAFPLLSFSPGGSHALVLGECDQAGTTTLNAFPLAGGPPVRLDALDLPRTDVSAALALDGGALYVADQERNEVFELFYASYEGGATRQLSAPLSQLGGGVSAWRLTPDAQRVVYLSSEQEHGGRDELFLTPLALSAPRRLSAALADGEVIESMLGAITPDSRTLIYHPYIFDHTHALLAVDLASGEITRLDRPSYTTPELWHFVLSPDGRHVAYCGEQDSAADGAYVARLADGAVTRLDAGREAGAHTYCRGEPSLRWTPDASRLIWIDSLYTGGCRVMAADPDGADLVAFGSEPEAIPATYMWFDLTPDGARLVWSGSDTSAGKVLRSARLDGAEQVTLDLTIDDSALGQLHAVVALAPDSARLVSCLADTSGATRLQAVPLDGGPARELGAGLALGAGPCAFILADGGARVAFADRGSSTTARHLWSAGLDGGEPVLLSDRLSTSTWTTFTDDVGRGRLLALLQDAADQLTLYAVPYAGGQQIALSRSFDPSWSDTTWSPLPRSGRVVLFLAAGPLIPWSPPAAELWLLAQDGSGQELIASGVISQWETTADESSLLYDLTEDASLGVRGLYARRLPPL